MFVDVDEYVHVMAEMQISANQFLLCYLLYTDQRVDGKLVPKGANMANFYKYTVKAKKWKQEEIDDLIKRGYVTDDSPRSNKTHPDYLTVTDLFVEKVFVRKNAFNEFWEAYPFTVPNFTDVRGPKIKMKACDMEALSEVYNRYVKTKAQHRKIMNVLQWAVENERLNVGIDKFVRGKQWEAFEEEMREETDNMHVV